MKVAAFAIIAVLAGFNAGHGATFDERLWEHYAPITPAPSVVEGDLVGVSLDPRLFKGQTVAPFLRDLRVVTNEKVVIPSQVVVQHPKEQTVERVSQIINLSLTKEGDTWLEVLVDDTTPQVNAVTIATSAIDFSRQTHVQGSNDGKTWNMLRADGVLFDTSSSDRLRHTTISFPATTYRHLAIIIKNSNAQPLPIQSVKVLFREKKTGNMYLVYGGLSKPTMDESRKENIVEVTLSQAFPVDSLVLMTDDHNFQRSLQVDVKDTKGEWRPWAQAIIYDFSSQMIHESQLAIPLPEITTKEFRLTFKNQDNPPVRLVGVHGEGYHRRLVFRQPHDNKLFLFWGNPDASAMQSDLGAVIAKLDPFKLPIVSIGNASSNAAFAGEKARLPWTERYKAALTFAVALIIAALVVLQFRVFKKTQAQDNEEGP